MQDAIAVFIIEVLVLLTIWKYFHRRDIAWLVDEVMSVVDE